MSELEFKPGTCQIWSLFGTTMLRRLRKCMLIMAVIYSEIIATLSVHNKVWTILYEAEYVHKVQWGPVIKKKVIFVITRNSAAILTKVITLINVQDLTKDNNVSNCNRNWIRNLKLTDLNQKTVNPLIGITIILISLSC